MGFVLKSSIISGGEHFIKCSRLLHSLWKCFPKYSCHRNKTKQKKHSSVCHSPHSSPEGSPKLLSYLKLCLGSPCPSYLASCPTPAPFPTSVLPELLADPTVHTALHLRAFPHLCPQPEMPSFLLRCPQTTQPSKLRSTTHLWTPIQSKSLTCFQQHPMVEPSVITSACPQALSSLRARAWHRGT